MNTRLLILIQTIGGVALTALHARAQSIYEPFTFTTIAGKSGTVGVKDATGSTARFNFPAGIAADAAGNLYVADLANNTIRKMEPDGTNWVVTTLAGKSGIAGSADGTNNAARFNSPAKLALDTAGNIYVSDNDNHTIRRLTRAGTNWVVTTIAGSHGRSGSADGTNSTARFNGPIGLAADHSGNLYVSDFSNHAIRQVTPVGTNWVVTTIAGEAGVIGDVDGTNSDARFAGPNDLAIDQAGNLYVTETANPTVRRLTRVGTDWVVTTLAGNIKQIGTADGIGGDARFNDLESLALDRAGNIYVGDWGAGTIRKVAPVGTDWVVTTLAGKAGSLGSKDGTGRAVRVNGPCPALDSAGNLYEADFFNSIIRKGYPALVIESSGPDFGIKDSQFSFDLNGPEGRLVIVEASTDLLNWLPIWTNTLASPLSPFVNFIDPQSDVHSDRFYRALTK